MIKIPVAAAVCFASLTLLLKESTGCAQVATPAEIKTAADYEGELVVCSAKAATLRESIECENVSRAKFGRPPRPIPAPRVDGGAS